MNPLGTAMAQQIDLQAEIESLRIELKFRTGQVEEKCLTIESLVQQLASANEAICGMKEALELASKSVDQLEKAAAFSDLLGGYRLDTSTVILTALSSAPVCRHKEVAEKQGALLKIGRIGAEDALDYIASLEAALAEERGKVMEAEFKLVHRRSVDDAYCLGCGSQQQSHWGVRHSWTDKYPDFDVALSVFVETMRSKFQARDSKQGHRSILRRHIKGCDIESINDHFWAEVNEAASAWKDNSEMVDVANMAFLRWWWLEEQP